LPAERPPALLVSLHDVSPLTLEASQEAARVARGAGIATTDLTVLVIPCHEGRAPLDQHPPTVRWLQSLEAEGATLVLHGLTHRMPRPLWNPLRWPWGYGFARGQGELYGADQATAEQSLDQARAILSRAGLLSALRGFIPPAWLLSPAAQKVVEEARFSFHELLGGIMVRGKAHAPEVVGWASLTAVEAVAMALRAGWQARRARRDTRVALHPADMRRPHSRASIERVLPRLRERLRPRGYRDYLAALP
jgi:predicted deacetylase